MSLTFVNHNGKPIFPARMAAMRDQGMELERQRRVAAKADPVSAHKGWRVSGIQPGKLEEAKQAHEQLRQMAQKAGGKPPEPFDETAWFRTAKRTASLTSFKRRLSNAKSWPSRRDGWMFNCKKSRRLCLDPFMSTGRAAP